MVRRCNAFEENYPDVESVLQLQNAIRKHQTPADFVRQTLNYNHTARANTLSAVVDWMSILAGHHLPPKQLNNIQEWAQSASCKDYKTLAIKGFGLAGFQYMRILFGADTIKPDRYICQFVEDYVGNKVSPQKALCLFEQAALDSGVSRRQADHYIWEMFARRAARAAEGAVIFEDVRNPRVFGWHGHRHSC